MKAPSERGIIGAWAYQARQELGMSVEQVATAMDARGQAVSPATIRGIESGSKKPGARLLRVLSLVLESPAPGAVKEPTGDASGLMEALTAALLAQAQALTDVRLALADARREAEEERETTAELIGGLARQLRDIQARVGMPAGSAAPGSDDH